MKYDFPSVLINLIKKKEEVSGDKKVVFDENTLSSIKGLLNQVNSAHFPEFTGFKLRNTMLSSVGMVDNKVTTSLCNKNEIVYHLEVSKDKLYLYDNSHSFALNIETIMGKFINSDLYFDFSFIVEKDTINIKKNFNNDIKISIYLDAKDFVKDDSGKPMDLIPDYELEMKADKDNKYRVMYREVCFNNYNNLFTNGLPLSLDYLRSLGILYCRYCHDLLDDLELNPKSK